MLRNSSRVPKTVKPGGQSRQARSRTYAAATLHDKQASWPGNTWNNIRILSRVLQVLGSCPQTAPSCPLCSEHTSDPPYIPLCPTSCLLPALFPLLRRPRSQPSACPHISSIMSQLTCDLFGGAALVNTLPSTPSFPSALHPFCSFHSTYQHPNSLYLSFCLHHPALKSKMAGGGHCLWNTGKYLFNEFLSHN